MKRLIRRPVRDLTTTQPNGMLPALKENPNLERTFPMNRLLLCLLLLFVPAARRAEPQAQAQQTAMTTVPKDFLDRLLQRQGEQLVEVVALKAQVKALQAKLDAAEAKL